MTTDTPTRAEIEHMAYNYGTEAAHHYWQLDRPDYDTATEWVRNAEAGTLHDYAIPGPFDEIPADLNTEGWSWSDFWYYEKAWESGYLDETTKLCRKEIASLEHAYETRLEQDHYRE
jgi:hypothetical protein